MGFSTVRTLRHVVVAWFCLLAAAFGGTLMFGTLVLASANVASCHFCTLSEVVTAAALHVYPTFSAFPKPFCFVAPAAER
jgi:uncharacterized membrane protein YczE